VAVRGQHAPPSSGCRSPDAGPTDLRRDGSRSALGTSAPMPQPGCPVIRAPMLAVGALGELLMPPCCAVDTSRSGCDPHGSQPLRTPAAPSEKIPGRGGWCTWRASADFRPRPAATGIGNCTAPAVTWTAAWSSIPHERGPARAPWLAGRFSASERADVGRVGFAPWFRHGRICSFELRGRRGIHPSAPGYVPRAGDAPASAPGPRAREPASRSGNVFMSPAPDRRANRRPERGGFRP
jgi:hypothetical protein